MIRLSWPQPTTGKLEIRHPYLKYQHMRVTVLVHDWQGINRVPNPPGRILLL